MVWSCGCAGVSAGVGAGASLIDAHGAAAFLRTHAAVGHDAGTSAVDRAFRATMGVTLDDSIALFDEMRRACPLDHLTANLVEYAAPELDRLTFHRGLDCADDDVVGPYGGDTAVAFFTVEAREPTSVGVRIRPRP